jgi:hypothetical protein
VPAAAADPLQAGGAEAQDPGLTGLAAALRAAVRSRRPAAPGRACPLHGHHRRPDLRGGAAALARRRPQRPAGCPAADQDRHQLGAAPQRRRGGAPASPRAGAGGAGLHLHVALLGQRTHPRRLHARRISPTSHRTSAAGIPSPPTRSPSTWTSRPPWKPATGRARVLRRSSIDRVEPSGARPRIASRSLP